MNRLATTTLLAFTLLAVATGGRAHAKPAKLYWELRDVREPAGTKPSMRAKAKEVFSDVLKKHPQVVTSLGKEQPKGPELAKLLKQQRLAGYGLVLRITKISHSMNPPAPGKVYKVLMVEVAVAIDAEKIPSGQMAMAGEGNASVGTEVSRFKEKERIQLAEEALAEAIGQAVTRSISKLAGEKKPKRRRRAR